MSASADIQTKTHQNVLSIPINAVTTRDKNDSTKIDKNADNIKIYLLKINGSLFSDSKVLINS